MRLLALFSVISFISIESRSNSGDRDPGQSDPPHFEATFESHESYRPTIRLNENLDYKSSAINNQLSFIDVLSSENVEYFEGDKENEGDGNHDTTTEKLESSEELESLDSTNATSFVPCESRATRVSSYSKLGTKVIAEDFNYSREESDNPSDSARTEIAFDVIHDVFETAPRRGGGLLEGIIYKRKLFSFHS